MGSTVNHVIASTSKKVPGLRRLPMLKLIAVAEVIIIVREHFVRLDPHERRRLVTLVGRARGRRGRLTPVEKDELSMLVAKTGPRELFGRTAEKLSPVPVPGPVGRRMKGTRGRARR
jgi:hypothetical protein